VAGVLLEKEKLDADEFVDVDERRALLPSGHEPFELLKSVPARLSRQKSAASSETPAAGSEAHPNRRINRSETGTHNFKPLTIQGMAGWQISAFPLEPFAWADAPMRVFHFVPVGTKSGKERNAVAKKQNRYGNESITSLKGADRVRLRPAVIFGSDGLDGCEHAIFEILSNSIDEARQGYGKEITITRFLDQSIEVEDHGRGIPVDFNKREKRYNWELVFCEMYAGGKYNNNDGGNYDFSLGLNGLGLCATQYASEYMDADIRYDGFRYTLHFEHGENVGGLKKEPYAKKKDTGSRHSLEAGFQGVYRHRRCRSSTITDTLRRQAIVNAGVKFIFKNEVAPKKFETIVFCYENGIEDHVRELVRRRRDDLRSVLAVRKAGARP
jgi:hypothetical protein